MMAKGVPETSPDVYRNLEKIEMACDLCPLRTLLHIAPDFLPGKDVAFNRNLCMDIIFLYGRLVLHVVNKEK